MLCEFEFVRACARDERARIARLPARAPRVSDAQHEAKALVTEHVGCRGEHLIR